MTAAERQASALNTRRLAWNGANVTAAVPSVLQAGTPLLTVTAPAGVAGAYSVGTASFGPALNSPGVTGEVMPVVDTAPNSGLACAALSALNAAAVDREDRARRPRNVHVQRQGEGRAGRRRRGRRRRQQCGRVSAAGDGGRGSDDHHSLRPDHARRTELRSRERSRRAPGCTPGCPRTSGSTSRSVKAPTPLNRALLYTPNPFQSGSSVSHWDTIAFPNQLMEPAINGDLTHEVAPPQDLTFPLLKDIGWN